MHERLNNYTTTCLGLFYVLEFICIPIPITCEFVSQMIFLAHAPILYE